ncbi:MAG: PorP/SprF family type IX secretion system membrane protein [Cyclobacteriaceae bacterium]|jgi:type IX secretion system PorP/SprF family membrane protein
MPQHFTLFILLLLPGIFLDVLAQEPQFSNFYATTLYTNPAFTGRSNHQYRIITDFRKQWHQIGSFSTAFVSADYAFNQFGVGFTAYADEAGSTPLKSVQSALSLSYGINITHKADLVMGFQGSYYYQRLQEEYIWIDDYLANNPDAIGQGIQNQYFNLSAGLLLVHESFWLGVSMKDFLPNPGLSNASGFGLISAGGNADAYYGRFSVHGGYSRYLMRQLFFSSYFNFRSRGTVRQWEGGFNVAYRPVKPGGHAADIVAGIGGGYRGFLQTLENLSTRDAVILNASLNWPKGFGANASPLWQHQIQVVYSYDITASRLHTTGGAHEVTLALTFSDFRLGSSWFETRQRRRHVADPRDCKIGQAKDVYVPR